MPAAEVVSCKFQNDANLYGALQFYLAYAGEHRDGEPQTGPEARQHQKGEY